MQFIKKSLDLLAIEASDQKRISGCSYRHRVTREKEDMSFIVSVLMYDRKYDRNVILCVLHL